MYNSQAEQTRNYSIDSYHDDGSIQSLTRTSDNIQFVLGETVLLNPFTKVEIDRFLIVGDTAFISHNIEVVNIDEILTW